MNRTLLSLQRRAGKWLLAADLGLRTCCSALVPTLRVSARTARIHASAVLQASAHAYAHCRECR